MLLNRKQAATYLENKGIKLIRGNQREEEDKTPSEYLILLVKKRDIKYQLIKGKAYFETEVLDELVSLLMKLNDYYNSIEAAELLKLKKQSFHAAKIKKFQEYIITHRGMEYFPKKIIDDIVIEKEAIANGTLLQCADLCETFDRTMSNITRMCHEGLFPNAYKSTYHTNIWLIPKEDVDNLLNYLESTYTIKEAFKLLGWVKNSTENLMKIVPSTKKLPLYFYRVPKEDLHNAIKLRDKKNSDNPFDILECTLLDWDYSDSIKETVSFFHDFMYKLLSKRSKLPVETNRLFIQGRTNALKTLMDGFNKNIWDITTAEMDLKFKGLGIRHKGIIIPFLKYCRNIKECKFDSSYGLKKPKKKITEPEEIFTEEEFVMFYNYIVQMDLHIDKAKNDYNHSNTWCFLLIHLTDAWRPTDIMTLPTIDLEEISVSSFDDVPYDGLTLVQGQSIINQILYKKEYYRSKTSANSMFYITPELIVPIATALTLVQLHFNQMEKPKNMKKIFQRKPTNRNYEYFFTSSTRTFPTFRSRKMNSTLMTYFYHHVVSKGADGDIALLLTQYLRNHKNDQTTTIYIKSQNKDGRIEESSFHIARRGAFGWLYELSLQLLSEEYADYNQEQRTVAIESLQKSISPIMLEETHERFIKQLHEKRLSIAMEVALMKPTDLAEAIIAISKGESPARAENAQCFRYKEGCINPMSSCMSCEYIVPKNYFLYNLGQELYKKLLKLLDLKAHQVTEREKETFLVIKLLDLVNQAQQEFGEEYVKTFMRDFPINTLLSAAEEKFLS
ncbi:hypothetical protein P9847_26865 [Paenibacillus chibensis]|uniref:Integrase n=1 Tax=Paenibacillus chibensis TaxID=59846 RepID=A0ABU6Q189_9BACL|nr:hypothetical protein [Paenibacillus chibensis]